MARHRESHYTGKGKGNLLTMGDEKSTVVSTNGEMVSEGLPQAGVCCCMVTTGETVEEVMAVESWGDMCS